MTALYVAPIPEAGFYVFSTAVLTFVHLIPLYINKIGGHYARQQTKISLYNRGTSFSQRVDYHPQVEIVTH